MIVLNEGEIEAGIGEGAGIPGFEKETAIVTKDLWLDQFDAGRAVSVTIIGFPVR